MESNPPKRSLDNIQTQVMTNIFKNSVILSKDNSSGKKTAKKMWEEIKKKLKNFQNLIKYNSINFKSRLDIDKNTSQVHFFSHCYSLDIQQEKEAFMDKITSTLLYFSYRSNFPPLTKNNEPLISSNESNGNLHTSDCGWGCMIRSSQMILSRALYKLFKRKYPSKKENVLLQCLFYFLDFPCDYKDLPESFLSILVQYNSTLRHDDSNTDTKSKHNQFESVIPPFSLRTLCSVGQLFNKKAGNWFSDFHLPQIFNLINREFGVLDDVSIMHFQGFVSKSKVIKECFTEVHSKDNENTQTDKSVIDLNDIAFESHMMLDDKRYSFSKSGLIFISTRLGLDKISSDYYDSIKEVFDCKQFLGFVGGNGVMAYYFFGFDESNLFYLDPHFNQEASPLLNDELLMSYLPKKIYQLKMEKLQTCLTFAFLFRDVVEYNMLFAWLWKYSQLINPCFTVVDSLDIDRLNKDDIINFDKDDF